MHAGAVATPATAGVAGPHHKAAGGPAPAYASRGLDVAADVAYPAQVSVVKRHLVPHPNAIQRAALTADVVGAGVTGAGPVSGGGRPGRGGQPAELLLDVLLTAAPRVALPGPRRPLGRLDFRAVVAAGRFPDAEAGSAAFQQANGIGALLRPAYWARLAASTQAANSSSKPSQIAV